MFSFPTGILDPTLTSTQTMDRWATYKWYNGKRSQYAWLTPAERESAFAKLKDAFNAYINSRMSIQTDNETTAKRSAMTFVSPGSHFERPNGFKTEIKVKEGISHEDFEKRKLAGEIIMSDYERADITVSCLPGLKGSTTSQTYQETLYYSYVADAGFLERIVGHDGKTYFAIPGTQYFCLSGYTTTRYMRFLERAVNPQWVFTDSTSAPFTANDVLAACRLHNPEDTFLFTEMLAKINRLSVDVLTAFAELPKSIESVYSGFKLVNSILKDARKGDFNVTKAYALREKRRTLRYKKRIARLDNEISSKNISSKRRDALLKHRDEIHVGHVEYLKRSAAELASAAADVWLNYRYNIMPNVYLAQDVLSAVQKYQSEWIKASFKKLTDASILVDSYRLDVDETASGIIKRSFSPLQALNAGSVISNDIFVTAWELVPLSFVYDWFINVGDLLQAQNYKISWDQQKCARSVELKIHTTIDVTGQFIIPPSVKVDGFYYKRKVVNPRDHCGLVWQPSVGLERQVDALALSWNSVRSLLQQGKKR